jgi:protein TIF31
VNLTMATKEEKPGAPAPDEVALAAEEEVLLKNLVILPPSSSSNLKPIVVPPLRPDEPVTSIRAALAELVGYAHITNYQLTCNGAALDDYGDLATLSEDSKIQMELQPYQTVREHILRLQQLLEGNPPVVKALVESQETKEEEPVKTEEVASKKGKKKEIKNDDKASTATVLSSPINLANFFDAATGQNVDDKLLKQLSDLEDIMMLSRVITISYLAPPTPQRKLFGDLAYLRINLSGQEDVFITAIPSGFHVNKSTATRFDPTPVSGKPCHSHALLDCLLQASPDYFGGKWNKSLESAQERLFLTTGDSPLQALHRVAVQRNSPRGLDVALFRPSWLVPAVENNWPAVKDHAPLPLEQDYPTFGLDLTTGVSRDWNEELQSAREMPIASIQERLERAR